MFEMSCEVGGGGGVSFLGITLPSTNANARDVEKVCVFTCGNMLFSLMKLKKKALVCEITKKTSSLKNSIFWHLWQISLWAPIMWLSYS